MGGMEVEEQDTATVEPFSEKLSEVREDSGVRAPIENLLGPTAVSPLEKTKLKKPKKKSKHRDRNNLKSADEENLHRRSNANIGSSEFVGREYVEVKMKPATPVEKLEDTEEPFSYPNEDNGDPLTQELAAKEAEVHELLESEVHLVETKGKEMSSVSNGRA